LCHVEGSLEAAEYEMQLAVDLMPVEVPKYVQYEVSAQQVSIFLARNRPAAAHIALQKCGFSFQEKFSFPALPDGNRISYSVGLLFNSGLRIIAKQAQAKDDLATGLILADDLIARASQSQQVLIMLDALLLRAQIHEKLGDQPKSQTDYIHALELAEPEGFIGIFIEQDPAVAKALADLIQHNQLSIGALVAGVGLGLGLVIYTLLFAFVSDSFAKSI
jgi:hypothetical protein